MMCFGARAEVPDGRRGDVGGILVGGDEGERAGS